MKFVLKRKVLREGDMIPVAKIEDIKVVATFRIKGFRDGVSDVALEVWYLEIEV